MRNWSYLVLVFVFAWGCQQKNDKLQNVTFQHLKWSQDILDYRITPKDSMDKDGLMFSDQGAWFAFGLQDSISPYGGFSGPFLMTQDNGIWFSKTLPNFVLKDNNGESLIDWKKDRIRQESYNSHLEAEYKNEILSVHQKLLFLSGHTALIETKITNRTDQKIPLICSTQNNLFSIGITPENTEGTIQMNSSKSKAIGYLTIDENNPSLALGDSSFYSSTTITEIKPWESKKIKVSLSFIFPEYSWEEEKHLIKTTSFDSVLQSRKKEKAIELAQLLSQQNPHFNDSKYKEVLAKAHLTLQNNWRIPAGEIKHEGLFPSYHYKWFNGFWSWDSWKHAVGLSYYDTRLAKEQIELMFDFQEENGFVADCVFRDTLIENHNYRDTKPPLSAWAVAQVFEKDNDLDFVARMYPKLKKYHEWWYRERDHDQDGICEYGSTDGSLIAAKWESGMDNAIRFDDTEILQNSPKAFSMNQESVDLNAYLYAEKLFLASLSKALGNVKETETLKQEAEQLKAQIQQQFYDVEDGWFYDTNLEGTEFIKGEGSEGWTALWANAATQTQAEAVKSKMMDPNKFFTKVPFQTMSADHEKFNPLKGYWRGPNWLDQAYFGVKGLRNYGFNEEANHATKTIIEGASGILEKGIPIRENYHPLTGEGLNAKNFSWSAAHLIMLLTEN